MKNTFSAFVFAVAFAGTLGSQSARAEAVKVSPKNLQVGETCAQVYILTYNESLPVNWGQMVGKYEHGCCFTDSIQKIDETTSDTTSI